MASQDNMLAAEPQQTLEGFVKVIPPNSILMEKTIHKCVACSLSDQSQAFQMVEMENRCTSLGMCMS